MIKSVSYDQIEIIESILELHVANKTIECDPTYSIGNFYNCTKIEKPIYRFDINPVDGVMYGDSRDLPLQDESINCMIFDPPFLASTGFSLYSDNIFNNKITKRFGFYLSEKELHQFYADSLKEAYRILNTNGILIFKCQDKVSSGKQYFSHCFIQQKAEKIGFYTKDLFILLSKNRIMADWQKENQKHARKYHCYFWVFQKTNKRIEYI